MDADELDICNYLKSANDSFVSGTEIARRAGGKRRFKEEPGWATLVLGRLMEAGLVEADNSGRYRLKPQDDQGKTKRWVAPHIRQILEKSGKKFDDVLPSDKPGES
jgi:hypothetical protein